MNSTRQMLNELIFQTMSKINHREVIISIKAPWLINTFYGIVDEVNITNSCKPNDYVKIVTLFRKPPTFEYETIVLHRSTLTHYTKIHIHHTHCGSIDPVREVCIMQHNKRSKFVNLVREAWYTKLYTSTTSKVDNIRYVRRMGVKVLEMYDDLNKFTICPICFEDDLNHNNSTLIIPCYHRFHTKCMMMFKRNITPNTVKCPCCKTPFTFKDCIQDTGDEHALEWCDHCERCGNVGGIPCVGCNNMVCVNCRDVGGCLDCLSLI